MKKELLKSDIRKCEEILKKEFTRAPNFWLRVKAAALLSIKEEKLPEMMKVESSNIDKIGHDQNTKTMYVQFLNGSLYSYADVSSALFSKTRDADSIGSFFCKNIKGKYQCEKIGNS